MTDYETPRAMRHDAGNLTQDARALLEATAEIADDKVAEARRRLNETLETGQQVYHQLRQKVTEGAQAADRAVHDYPYPTMAVIFGLGALLGLLLSRRD
jgi:ElaB/YqjD/DUF883 family membrane-anchored ribosome-binding protein